MRSLDWQEAFHDAPPRRDLAFRRKQDDRNFLVRLPLGLKHRISAAVLNSGQLRSGLLPV